MASTKTGSDTALMTANLDSLRDVSARIGADELLVQGGGGNSSVKIEDVMWVKASGAWLRDATARNIFTPLALTQARALAAGGSEDFTPARLNGKLGSDLRPSIESAMHALMPHRYVLHAHPVNVICATLTADMAGIAKGLDGLAWAQLPYIQPGPELGKSISQLLAQQAPDVLVLSNHGLVVGAPSAADAERLMRDIEARLARPPAPVVSASPSREMPAPDGYRWLTDETFAATAHGLAHDAARVRLITGGALVPDQVVYLGGAAVLAASAEAVEDIAADWMSRRGVAPGLVFVDKCGALVRSDLTNGGLALAGLLCEIALRLPMGEMPRTLTLDDELTLLGWEAEKYRQAIDAGRS